MSCAYLRVVCGGHAAGVASGHDHTHTLGHGRASASRQGDSSVSRCQSESERLSGVEIATHHRHAREPSRPPHERREPRVLGCSTVCRCTRTRGSRRMGRLRSWASIHQDRSGGEPVRRSVGDTGPSCGVGRWRFPSAPPPCGCSGMRNVWPDRLPMAAVQPAMVWQCAHARQARRGIARQEGGEEHDLCDCGTLHGCYEPGLRARLPGGVYSLGTPARLGSSPSIRRNALIAGVHGQSGGEQTIL